MPAKLDAMLATHVIDPTSVRRDDFTAFFERRQRELVTRIEGATGKNVGTEMPDEGDCGRAGW